MDIVLDLINLSPTPVDLFQNFPALRGKHLPVHNLYFQVHKNNTGDVYIGKKNMNITTEVGIVGVIRPPTSNGLPDLTMEMAGVPNPYILDEYFVAGSVTGDKVRVTAQIA